MSVNVGVVGATGIVGETFLQLMAERNFPVNELRLFASPESQGKRIEFNGRQITCNVLSERCFDGLDVVFFSSGDEISRKWAPQAVRSGAFAIDNSAAFRMNPDHKLIVPEINGRLIPRAGMKKELIANPNCSTIQLVMALAPLAVDFGISRVQVATYQSVSGAGREGRTELIEQLAAHLTNESNDESKKQPVPSPKVFSHPIAFNSIPHIGSFDDNGFSSEENKIMKETCKIMGMPTLTISAFCVRVPSLNGHGEAVWVTLDQEVTRAQVAKSLSQFKGLQYVPHDKTEQFPTPALASGEYPVYVGRVHIDPQNPNTVMMWVVADNLRKGAALNGLQIAEHIFEIR